jgi:serine/threonine protein phosphatase PrpC
MVSAVVLRASGDSHTGKERKNNEDRLHCDPERGIFIVVDGVGGQAAGEKAAEVALTRIRTRLERRTGGAADRIREAIAVANNEIYQLSQSNPAWRGMACVLTVAIVDNGRATIGHVGDSRLYKIRQGEIRKITHDHSPVGELEESAKLSEIEAMRHPRRHEVYRVVGAGLQEPDDADFIESIEIPFEPDSALLLCTDGLSDLVTSSEILGVVARDAGDPERAVKELIGLANRAGGKDNVSVIVIEGEKFAPPRKNGFRLRRNSEAKAENDAPRSPATSLSRSLSGRAALFLYGLLSGIGLITLSQFYMDSRSPQPTAAEHASFQRFLVSPTGGEFTSISRALDAARPGDMIEVAPGEYHEQIRMKEEITLVSQKLREAVLALPEALPQDKIGITIRGIRGGRLSGFKVQSERANPATAGISIIDSDVVITDMEILGAEDVGVLIGGKSAPALAGNYIHDNIGEGVVIQGEAAARLTNNLIVSNGKQSGKRKPGISIFEQANPVLERNVIAGNGMQGILNTSSASSAQKLWNNFFTLPQPSPAGLPAGVRKRR